MIPEISLTGLVVVAAIAFVVPLALGLVPALRVPSFVVEIVTGIVIGPAVLGLAEVDPPLRVMALLGLAFLLLLAGLEIDLDRLRGARVRSAAVGFVVSLALALGIGLGLYGAGLIGAPLLVAIIVFAIAKVGTTVQANRGETASAADSVWLGGREAGGEIEAAPEMHGVGAEESTTPVCAPPCPARSIPGS